MSGIVDNTGAVSGIIGTTVGTPAASNVGASAFAAAGNAAGWVGLADTNILEFDTLTSLDGFSAGTGSADYNTGTYKYNTPAAGIYMFGMHIYTGHIDTTNAFYFDIDGTGYQNGAGNVQRSQGTSQTADDSTTEMTILIELAADIDVCVKCSETSTWHESLSHWWGLRIT